MTTPATLTSSAPAPYLDAVAATDLARAYKNDLLTALAVAPGHHVLDLGCGPGTDLAALATAVGPSGLVVGVDQDPAMVATARTRMSALPTVRVQQADAHHLPFAAHTFDRARADRVLMHVADPAAVLTELHRVLHPGALLTLAEPDWDTLAVDHPDLPLARTYTRFVAETTNRNPAIGRRLPRIATQSGFTLHDVRNAAPVFTDFATADTILGLHRTTARAVTAGYFTPEDARTWLDHLTSGQFFATVSFVMVLARSGAGGAEG